MTERRPITDEDRRRAVESEMRRRWPFRLRITRGQRRAILAGKAYRDTTNDAGDWAWP